MKASIALFSLLPFTVLTAHAELVDFGGGLQIDFTTIGDAGNAADTAGRPSPAGAVAYEYVISTYEISRAQIAASGLGLTLVDPPGTITGDTPATGISWIDSAKFVNYLNTSVGAQEAYKFDGGGNFQLWDSGDAGYDAANPYRNSLAEYWLPDIDEWYKAAYYDPGTGTYFDYPTGSDTAPTAVTGGTSANTAVYDQASTTGPAEVDNAGGLSPYGVMGLGGNVFEWGETAYDLVNDSTTENRVIRGGTWTSTNWDLESGDTATFTNYYQQAPTNNNDRIGLRVAGAVPVAAVPEPTTMLSLWLLAGIASVIRRRRRIATH